MLQTVPRPLRKKSPEKLKLIFNLHGRKWLVKGGDIWNARGKKSSTTVKSLIAGEMHCTVMTEWKERCAYVHISTDLKDVRVVPISGAISPDRFGEVSKGGAFCHHLESRSCLNLQLLPLKSSLIWEMHLQETGLM